MNNHPSHLHYFVPYNFIVCMSQSQSETQSQLRQTNFRTLYKDRSNKSLNKERRSLNVKIGHHSSLQKLHTKLDQIQRKDLKRQERVEEGMVTNALQKLNFDHHNPEECLCGSCECGRHLCKFKIIRPDMIKKTSYERQFPIKMPFQSDILIQKQTKPLNGDHLDLNTNYKCDFKNSILEKIVKPKPMNNLKEIGPIQSFTTYQNAFKDFKVPNQYIKPTDRHTRQSFPFRSKSHYSKQFTTKSIKRHQSLKSIDQISLGKLWLGESTYNQSFQRPSRDHILNPIAKNIEKMNKTLDDKLRFKTNYKSDFTQKVSPICPSKRLLQHSIKFSELKHKLSENADYKSMSPGFHAISTSKHFYV